VRRTCLLLSWCAMVACAGSTHANVHNLAHASHPRAGRSGLVPARFFADPEQRHHSVAAVREVTEPQATIAGHYSQAIVNCGTGCTVSWIVDRHTGAIIKVPLSSIGTEVVDDVRGRLDSDHVEVIYGPNPAHGLTGPCRARSFRLRGTRFTAISGFSPARCP